MTGVAASLPSVLPDLRRFAASLTHDRADADDLVQDTCVRALASADAFDGSDMWAWAATIMRNLFRDSCRRRALRFAKRHLLTVDPAISGGQEAAVMLREAWDAGRRHGGFDEPLMLKIAVGMEATEIAAALGISRSAAKSRIHRSRNALKEATSGRNATGARA